MSPTFSRNLYTILVWMEPSPSSFLVLSEQSDIDLCHSLANLVGVVLGCPSSSNHLWYHLFHPEELPGTYMTGFMVLCDCSKVRLWPPFIHVLLPYTYHSTILKLAIVVIAMTVEWNSLLRDSLVDQTTWSMLHEGRTPSTPFTSCSGPTLGLSVWHSWPSQRLKQLSMVPSSQIGFLCDTTVSLSCALYGCTCELTLVFQIRRGPSWSCVVPSDCMRYAMNTCCIIQQELFIKDPQCVFDMITDLIVATFTFDRAAPALCEQFTKKGIFPLDVFEKYWFMLALCCPSVWAAWLHLHTHSQVFNSRNTAPNCQQGIFKTCQELDNYERMWHTHIYQPSWSKLKTEVRECSVCNI